MGSCWCLGFMCLKTLSQRPRKLTLRAMLRGVPSAGGAAFNHSPYDQCAAQIDMSSQGPDDGNCSLHAIALEIGRYMTS